MLASYAAELHALKTELQSTLARLGIDSTSSEEDTDSQDHPDTSSAAETTATTAETDATRRRSRRSRNSDRNRPITRWNRRQLTQELAAASRRRRELEMQLQRELLQRERQDNDQQDQEQEQQREQRRSRRRSAWQVAIAELQQQRARILRQIEHETAADAAATEERRDTGLRSDAQETEQSNQNQVRTVTQPPVVSSNSETQYSIGGVVTLEPLSSSQRRQMSAMTNSRSGVSFQPAVAVAAPEMNAYPRQHYRNTPDALSDVFSLQVKFAETMLKLEKSVQMRDQLLHHERTSNLPKRRTATQTSEEASQVRCRSRQHRRRSFESGSNSDSSVMYRENHSSESFSSSAYSFSSLDSTPHRGQTIRVRYPSFRVSRATTAETLAPSSSGADNSPGAETTDRAAPVSSITTTTLSLHESPETAEGSRNSDVEHPQTIDELEEETHRTPTTGSSVTTPTTGSDQKSSASSSKQVRFGEDAYSTPVLARKFNFDGPSIDEDDDEEKEEEVGSVLSFLGGSSVTSAELNDASFVRAFERFRRELSVSRHNFVTQSPLKPPLARKLFPAQSVAFSSSKPNEAINIVLEGAQGNAVEPTTKSDALNDIAAFPALDGLSIVGIQERRRQLCLDIQAESAQLVLNFGAMQNVAAGSQDSEHTKNRLLALRDELKAIDVRLSALADSG